MNKRIGLLAIALLLSVGWYFFVGWADRQLAIHQHTSLTSVCLQDHPPAGSVVSPEGGPKGPKAGYEFVPLGIHCEFTIKGGAVIKTFNPRTAALALALPPLATSIAWGAWTLTRGRARRGRARPAAGA